VEERKDEGEGRDLKLAGLPLTASPVDVVASTASGRPSTFTPFSWPARACRQTLPIKSQMRAVPSYWKEK
jgi:hypothetical protein